LDQTSLSWRTPSFSDDTEHLYDNRLRCHHFSELFDERH
jgi:hypothetical protein